MVTVLLFDRRMGHAVNFVGHIIVIQPLRSQTLFEDWAESSSGISLKFAEILMPPSPRGIPEPDMLNGFYTCRSPQERPCMEP